MGDYKQKEAVRSVANGSKMKVFPPLAFRMTNIRNACEQPIRNVGKCEHT